MYVKLFQKILDSSIWLEKDSTLRVWITVLCSMDVEGFCAFASVDNLARRANVKPCHALAAIAILEAPDQKSANDDHQGRRIERVQGGWNVLNSKKYRDITRGGELRSSRSKSSQVVSTGSNSFQSVLPTDLTTNGINKSLPDVEVEVDTDKTTTTKRKRKKFSFEGFAEGTSEVVNCFLPIWPEKRRDGSEVNVSKAMFADRVSELLRDGFTVQQLIACGNSYLDEKPDWPACPQYFFGPGNGKSANFSSYMKMLIHQTSKQAGQ